MRGPGGGYRHRMAKHTTPNAQTRDAEAAEALKDHGAGDAATPDEAEAADGNRLDPGVASHEQEMAERGAHQQGEGRLP